MLALEVADLAEQVLVLLVGQRRAAVLHRVLERLDHGPVEAAHLLGREALGAAVVAQAGGEEDLVGVDVADAGDELLVHQQGLELGLLGLQQVAEDGPAHDVFERVEAEVRELGHLVVELVHGR